MTHFLKCDGCGQEIGAPAWSRYTTVEVSENQGYGDEGLTLHFCHARDGGSVGCGQFVKSVLGEIGDRKKARNAQLDEERKR